MFSYNLCNPIEFLKTFKSPLTPLFQRGGQEWSVFQRGGQALSALCFLLLALCFSAYAAPPLWTQSSQLSLGTAFSSEADACSRDNEIYVVWSDDRTGNREIFFAASQDVGETWSTEERLTNTLDESIQPAIACDRRNLYVVWREKSEDDSHIYYKNWDGSAWSENSLLSGDFENSRRPEIASTILFPGSYLYIAWDSGEDDESTTYLIRSADSGRVFSTPEPVTTGSWDTKEPAIWGGARDVYLVWADNREGNWGIFFRRWGEVQPGPEVKLSSLFDCNSPTISGREPEIYAAWQCVEKDAVYADIYFSSSMNYGADWTGAERFTEGEAESILPKIVMSGAESDSRETVPWVFWQDGRNGEWQILFLMLDAGFWMLDDEERLSSMEFLTDIDRPATLLDAVSAPGQIHAFWSRFEGGSQANIMYMRRDTVPPQRPGAPSHFDLTAVPGYDDDTQITFSWEAAEPEGTVEYNIYSEVDDEGFVLIGNTADTSHNVQGESGRTHRIYVEAVDEVGNVSLPSEISAKVICDSTPPVVVIHSPRSDSTMRGSIPVIVSVHDENLLEYNVEFGVTAVPSVWEQLAPPANEEVDRERIITWETSELDGIYTLRISARDEAGNESKAEAMVNIDSRPPMPVLPGEAVSLTDPDSEWTYGMPSWSPGGDAIAFHSDAGGTEDIWIMAPIEVGFVPAFIRITRSSAIEHSPTWAPAGDMMAFQSLSSQNEADSWGIWVVNSDGSGSRQLTQNASSDMNPAWSQDGSSIAFDSDRDGDSEIWLITNVQSVLSGTEPQFIQLTHNDWEDKHATWSPDGSKVIFQSSRRGNWDLFEIGIDGTELNVIIDTPADEIEPHWSPDRKRVLFSTNEPGDHYEIRAIDWPEATNQVRLSPEGEDARYASWSPGMDFIVYQHEGSLYSSTLLYPAGDLKAVISWPRGGEALAGWVDVEGIAGGENFQRYALQYAAYDKPDKFQPIGGESTSPVPETGFLGRWHTEALEGEFLLRLVVTSMDGSEIVDSVRVLIANQLPFILLDEPQDELVTNKSIITVSGRTGQRTTVTLNGSEISVDKDGRFSQKIQLSEGANNITVEARSPSGQGGQYVVERTITLDTEPPGITIESPADFQVIHVPYVMVKGNVDEQAEVSVLSERVWPDGNGNFQRTVSCSEGMNIIQIIAFDRLGRFSAVSRRVIFQREMEGASDISAPAITDVFPDNNAVFTGRNLQLSATLIDDTGLDPLSIALLFDNEEIASEDYSLDVRIPDVEEKLPLDQYPVIHLTYRPPHPVSEGGHSFKIDIQDTSGNTGESTFSFSVDTVASEAIISAILDDTDRIKVIAVANKPLARIGGGVIYDPVMQNGYSLSSFTQVEGHYEAFLNISPSQQNFIIDFVAETQLGDEIMANGYMAWHEALPGRSIRLGVDDMPQFSSTSISSLARGLIFTLRSQDGLDADLLTMQDDNAEDRRLQSAGLAYVLSASEELEEIEGIFSLPVSDFDAQALVMFHWDEELRLWQPLDRMALSDVLLTSRITRPGAYTLLADVDSPTIGDVSPVDAGEVPLDRFMVEANVLDRGSGIWQIRLMIDGRQVDYEYVPETGQLTYFPSMLEWGLHKMEIIATDRAGNVAEFATSFLTEEVFQFILIRAYPNPANSVVNVKFKITRLADVELRIYTVAGELVYSSNKTNVAEGNFTWKCENSAGTPVASGVYFYTIEAVLYETKVHERGAIAVIK